MAKKPANKSPRSKKAANTKPELPTIAEARMHRSTLAAEVRKKAMLEALEQSLGVVTTACRKLGLNRTTFYEYCKDPVFRAAYEELQNVALDFAETKLHQRINEGSDAATIFYLKTKGKGRGYVERTEISGGGNPIAIRVVTTDADITGAIDQL